MEKFYCAILAGGLSKRMNSKLSKVLHKVSGKTMIEWAV
ncbi:MAG: NTP transferase domain-containing protein, partial [Candidatus Caldipriscus sp.]